jgi:hypothetical protein
LSKKAKKEKLDKENRNEGEKLEDAIEMQG